MFKRLVPVVAVAVGLTTPLVVWANNDPAPSTAEVAPAPAGHFSKETPYGSPSTSTMAPPAGYSMIFIESIGRHGSRASTSASAENQVLKLWRGAQDDELTTLGKALPADVESFQTAENKVGYGDLSTRGKAEWAGIGARTATSYESFFAAMHARKWSVSSITTTIHRTKQSLAAFEGGLMTNTNVKIGKASADKSLIDFDSARSKQGTRDLDTIKSRPDVVEASTNILERIYSASYVSSLKHPVDEALDIYQLYCIAAGMNEDTDVTFANYVGADAAVMAYARDAAAFYKYGPGVKGENGTYKGAKPLRTAFFKALDARIDGGKKATVFRLAHGETTMPFAALLQLPGSEKHATKGTPYTYANNPWRGDKIGGMAGNIEWVAYRNSKKKVLVTMRYNEVPALFRSACKPVSGGSYFYKPSELKRCLPKS